jgi:hypothetical protein
VLEWWHQAIPRTVWLDPSGKQLLQWPIEEVEALRGKSATLKDRVIKPGQHLEVTGLQTAQVRRACYCKLVILFPIHLPNFSNDRRGMGQVHPLKKIP